MIRTLLTTTAIAALLGTAVIAQDSAPANTVEAPANTTEAPANTTEAPADGTTAPAQPTEAPTDSTLAPAGGTEAPATEAPATNAAPAPAAPIADNAQTVNQPWDISAGYVSGEGEVRASDLMGAGIFSSAGDDAEEIGTVNDLIFSVEGDVNAVIIGVGGFLGIGEKLVAADFAMLEWTLAADGTERWVMPTTREALEAAPEFVWEEDLPVMDPAMAPADPAMAPADPAMAPADPAMAPADPAMAPADPAMAPADPAAPAAPQ